MPTRSCCYVAAIGLFGRRRKPANDDATGRPAADPSPLIEDLNAANAAWLSQTLAELGEQGLDPADLGALERHYDEAYRNWVALSETERPDANTIINRVGVALGHHLAARSGMRWVIATDAYGTGLALHRAPGDILIYPQSMIGKRWAEGETGFIVGLADFTAERVAELAGQ